MSGCNFPDHHGAPGSGRMAAVVLCLGLAAAAVTVTTAVGADILLVVLIVLSVVLCAGTAVLVRLLRANPRVRSSVNSGPVVPVYEALPAPPRVTVISTTRARAALPGPGRQAAAPWATGGGRREAPHPRS